MRKLNLMKHKWRRDDLKKNKELLKSR